LLCTSGFGSLAEVKKMTPRQIHAAFHHIQIAQRARLADLTRAVYVGAQADHKGLENFVKDLTRDV
jgi:hypothetical protein